MTLDDIPPPGILCAKISIWQQHVASIIQSSVVSLTVWKDSGKLSAGGEDIIIGITATEKRDQGKAEGKTRSLGSEVSITFQSIDKIWQSFIDSKNTPIFPHFITQDGKSIRRVHWGAGLMPALWQIFGARWIIWQPEEYGQSGRWDRRLHIFLCEKSHWVRTVVVLNYCISWDGCRKKAYAVHIVHRTRNSWCIWLIYILDVLFKPAMLTMGPLVQSTSLAFPPGTNLARNAQYKQSRICSCCETRKHYWLRLTCIHRCLATNSWSCYALDRLRILFSHKFSVRQAVLSEGKMILHK